MWVLPEIHYDAAGYCREPASSREQLPMTAAAQETTSVDDVRLIRLCQQGHPEAFDRLVERYMRRAYAAALVLTGNREDALDLSQEAFVRVFRNIRRYDPDRCAFFTWYYRILRNLVRNEFRRRRRWQRFLQRWRRRSIEVAPLSPEARVEAREMRNRVWHVLQQLSLEDREIILLKDLYGLRYREIAEWLGCPVGTVMSRLYHARRRFRALWEQYDGTAV